MLRIRTAPFDRALVVESPHPSLDAALAAYGIEVTRLDKVADDAALIRALRDTGAQVLFKRSRIAVTREVIAAAPELHAVQLCCIGDDSVDKVAAADAGVLVLNDPVSNGRSVMEMAIGLMLTLSRRLFETNDATHAHQWDKSDRERYEVLGKRLGIVGLGNIGRQVAKQAAALGMEVQFFDSRFVAQEVGLEMGWKRCADIAELFRTSDIVSIHTSARDAWDNDNGGLFDPYLSQLGADRPESSPRVFLNLARGNLFASERLADAVRSGQIRRAAVDVYPEEPSPGYEWENPYFDLPQVVCTPHIGAATQEAQPRIATRVARTIGNLSRFGSIRDCVFSPRAELSVPTPEPGQAILAVVHSTSVGTRKAVADAIYEARVSTLGSTQQDFPLGVAYDLSVLERPLPEDELRGLVDRARAISGDPTAIRAVRQVVVAGRW
jgi:D-3-phosphoglycerate dehydrogenase